MIFSVALHERGAEATLRAIERAEALGIGGVWLTSAVGDQLNLYAAASQRTRRIRLGTAVVPIFPRHPVLLAQQAAMLDELAPGRLRLGVGPSHERQTSQWHGLEYRQPLGHLREVVAILRQAFEDGRVEYRGSFYQADFPFARTCQVPVLTSALGAGAFTLAGEISAGALSWVCPPDYLAGVARPALERGAKLAGRPVPPLLGHVFLGESREALHQRLETYRQLPNYQRMFAAAGVSPDELVDHVGLWGSAEQRQQGLREWAGRSTADEVICSLLPSEQFSLEELLLTLHDVDL